MLLEYGKLVHEATQELLKLVGKLWRNVCANGVIDKRIDNDMPRQGHGIEPRDAGLKVDRELPSPCPPDRFEAQALERNQEMILLIGLELRGHLPEQGVEGPLHLGNDQARPPQQLIDEFVDFVPRFLMQNLIVAQR